MNLVIVNGNSMLFPLPTETFFRLSVAVYGLHILDSKGKSRMEERQ